MALLRSLTTAITGLRNHQTRLDVIGNNLANVNTSGYKAERVQFSTLFSQTIGSGQRPTLLAGGKDPKSIGVGMQVSEISRNFNQGALENTGLKTDVGIDGEGFFVLDTNGQQVFTRDGAFELGLKSFVNENSTVENKRVLVHKGTGLVLQGQTANTDGSVDAPSMGSIEDIEIPLGELQLGQATENSFFFGNFNADGDVAFTGSRSTSGSFFMDANTSVFADSDTDLTSVYTDTGDLLMQNGDDVKITGTKGGRAVENTFTYGKNKDGTTMGDFALFMQRIFGLHTDNTIRSDNADQNATPIETNAGNTGSDPELDHDVEHDDGIADNDGVNETRLLFSSNRGMNATATDAVGVATNTIDLTTGVAGASLLASFDSYNTAGKTPTLEFDMDNDGAYETTASMVSYNAGTSTLTIGGAGVTPSSVTGEFRVRIQNTGTAQIGDSGTLLNGVHDAAGGQSITVSATTLTLQGRLLSTGANILAGDSIHLSGPDVIDGFYNIENIVENAGNTLVTLDREAGSGQADYFIGNIIQDTNLVGQIDDGTQVPDQIYLDGDGVIEGLYTVLGTVDTDGDGNDDSVRLGFSGNGDKALTLGDNAFSGISGKETDINWTLNPAQIYINGNLGIKNQIDDIKFVSGTTTYADFTTRADADGESISTSMVVFDTQGDSHQVNLVATRINTTNNSGAEWRWYADAEDDDADLSDEVDPDIAVGAGTIRFDNDGQYTTESLDQIQIDLDNGQATQLIVDPDFSGMTQLASGDTGSDLNLKEQDGLGRGVLNDWSISDDGTVVAVYSNGLTRNLARIAVSTFRNNNGLIHLGGNLFREDLNTGGPRANIPGQNEAGSIRAFTLESSNVDLSSEFTNMITTQRGFQANARTITTSDEFLLELVNLKR